MGRIIKCPICSTRLTVPVDTAKCKVRCAKCGQRFYLPERPSVVENKVVSWLSQDLDDEVIPHNPAHNHNHDSVSGRTTVLPVAAEKVRLVRLDANGVLFEFSSNLLKEPAFRCALPRCCLRCGARSHLDAHMIVYSHQLRDSFSMEDEHNAGQLIVKGELLAGLECENLLAVLPKVPNIPHPADLPMPYWLCDMCSGTGMIGGQVQINSQTEEGHCRLQIRNLRRAEEFILAAGGESSIDCKTIHKHVLALKESPWETLSTVVQNRLVQWFRPRTTERFIAYVADRDHVRTEDGMNGIVISNHRMIYHTQLRHHEITTDEPMEMQLAATGGKGSLVIRDGTSDTKRITLDRDGITLMRRGLAEGKFKVVWK